ncbi:GntR family transcriptional regulator [Poriferisphaera sp. WC338]|uniref:GntR family transcriptional regulator n=1 Tax=Poriferisphaera sp. WC338 TaxID=3425129 RepID=UPI003D8161E1
MATSTNTLNPIEPKPGCPLYEVVKETVVQAIESGHFHSGERMPSTKELSRQLSVSLVTVHRALQDLVNVGYLERTQGRGTFVVEDRKARSREFRFGLVIRKEASIADIYHSQILEGMRLASHENAIDLNMMHYENDPRQDCDAHLLVNPTGIQIEEYAGKVSRNQPILIVGTHSQVKNAESIDVDNANLAQQAIRHLHGLGHQRFCLVVGAKELSTSQDRVRGFEQVCNELGISPDNRVIVQASSWHLLPQDKMKLKSVLNTNNRPTAVFAGGYFLALDTYDAIATVGLRIPDDISVVGVDDPASAAHLSPPLTTLRQPLVDIGYNAVTTMREFLVNHDQQLHSQMLQPELVIRKSSGSPKL